MHYVFKYSGFNVLRPLGERPILRINSEVNLKMLHEKIGGKYPLLLNIDEYTVDIYSSDSIPPHAISREVNVGVFRGYAALINPDHPTYIISFDIPVSKTLLDIINKIRLSGRVFIIQIQCKYSACPLTIYSVKIIKSKEYILKHMPDGTLSPYMVFSSEELTNMLRELEYVDVVRLEIPVHIKPKTAMSILRKCLEELKGAHKELIEGNYRESINICRNIIMNYLIPPEQDERKLRKEIIESIKPPREMHEKYKLILRSIEITLKENLRHIHKFIKEDTGELLIMPLREDAEYIFMMLSIITKYLSELCSM